MKSTLRNAINARIPELLELKMGCEVRATEKLDTCTHHYDATIIRWKQNELFNICYIVMGISLLPGHDVHESHVIEKNQIYKILGTPPSWSDYLRCLGDDYAIWGDGMFFVNDEKEGSGPLYIDDKIFKVDLTKSVLEQSDEILQKLVDLIPNK